MKSDVIKNIKAFIDEGEAIAEQAESGEISCFTNGSVATGFLDDIFSKYTQWRDDIENLKKIKETVEKNGNTTLNEADGIPHFCKTKPDYAEVGILHMPNNYDLYMQKIIKDPIPFLKNLRTATNKKISKLREVIDKVSDKDNNKDFPIISLPQNTQWEDIEIKFKDKFEIEIFVKNSSLGCKSFESLKFCSGTKNKKPDKQWIFLELVSISQAAGEKKVVKHDLAMSLRVKPNNCEKIKSNLSKRLQEIFGINDEPFYPYKSYGYYKPKFTLKPVPTMRNENPFITRRSEFKEGFNYNEEQGEDGFVKL